MPFLAAPVYTATKSAIHSYTQSIRQALKSTSINVYEALPPMVDTDMSKGLEMKGMVKMSPDKLAEIIIKQMQKGKTEIKPGASAMMIRMYKLFPWLINAMMRKMAPAILVGAQEKML
jgi:short-subunit dehydrogenase involved in D-alanine esterification of teichoic acids